MGSTLPFAGDREIQVAATGQDEIERIDILKNNRVIARYFPEDHYRDNEPWPGEVLCRLEFGWGPWADLAMTRVADWDVGVTIRNGKILAATPCFQSGPFEEERRDRIVERSESACRIQMFTSRRQAFKEIPTKSVVVRLAGGRNASVEVKVSKPSPVTVRKTLGELAEHNEVEFTGPFTAESFVIHRLVTPQQYKASFRHTDRGKRGQTDWYYARVIQMNGHQAWSSPIWVEG
jgi:hypothetical protein